MAKVTFVKKARKDIKGTSIKKGDSYYWWKLGIKFPKRYSTSRPKASQLTTSEFLSTIYSVQEDIDGYVGDSVDEAIAVLNDCRSTIDEAGSDCLEKHGNMPDSLQQSPTGELLENRASACEDLVQIIDDAITELETVEENIKGTDETWR